METIGVILYFVGIAFGIGSLVCWIMEIVAAFKNGDGPLLGILSIIPCGGLGGLIIGWMNAGKWGIQKLMTVWTVLIIVNIVFSVAGMSLGMGSLLQQMGAEGQFPPMTPDAGFSPTEGFPPLSEPAPAPQ